MSKTAIDCNCSLISRHAGFSHLFSFPAPSSPPSLSGTVKFTTIKRLETQLLLMSISLPSLTRPSSDTSTRSTEIPTNFGTVLTVFLLAVFGTSAPDISALPVILLASALCTGVRVRMAASGQPAK